MLNDLAEAMKALDGKKRRNENVIQFWGPHFGVHIWTQKWGQPSENFAAAAHVVQADLRPCSLNMNVNSNLFLFVRPKSGCYCTRNKVGRRERKSMY